MKLGVVVACLATAAGMQIDVPLPIGHDLVGMRESLRSMVGTKISDETKELLVELVRNITNEVESDVVREHNEAEALCGQRRSSVQACNDVRNDAGEKESKIAEATSVSREAHVDCRATEQQKCETKVEKITDFRALVRSMVNGMHSREHNHHCEADDGNYASHKPGYNASIATSDIAVFMKNEQAYHSRFYDDYTTQSAACKTATGDWKNEALWCDGLQTAFEADFCAWRNNATEMCETYRRCRHDTESAYNQTIIDNAAMEANLKNQWKALKLLECYADMIHNEVTDFATCNLDTNVSHLEISCDPYPAPLNCDLTDVVHGPCDNTWTSQYYDPITSANACITLRPCTPCGDWDGDETN